MASMEVIKFLVLNRQNSRFRIVRNKENIGVVVASNLSVHTSGEWFKLVEYMR